MNYEAYELVWHNNTARAIRYYRIDANRSLMRMLDSLHWIRAGDFVILNHLTLDITRYKGAVKGALVALDKE